MGFKGRFTYDINMPVGMKRKIVDIKQKSWGWKPKTSLEEGIKLIYNVSLVRKV